MFLKTCIFYYRLQNTCFVSQASAADKGANDHAEGDTSTAAESSAETLIASEPTFADEQKIHITKLSRKVTEEQVRSHFEEYGEVLKVEVVESRQSRSSEDGYNFGRVTFRDKMTVNAVLADKVSFFVRFLLNNLI